MIAHIKRFIAFAVAIVTISLSTFPATAQEGSSEARRFSGVYVDGWEVQLFIENGRENEQPYWIAFSPETRAALAAVFPAALEPGEGVRVRITFDGRLSPPGRYGHLSAYPHAVLVENVVSAQVEGRPSYYCDAAASGYWRGADGQPLLVTATTTGPNCRQSVVLMIVRNSEGNVLWTDAIPAARVMGLNTPNTRTPMTSALRDWIAFGARGQTTADLPAWVADNVPPSASGFEFAPEPWINRAHYSRMRERAEPMFCYVQGRGSLACLVEQDDRLEKIGVQSFPG